MKGRHFKLLELNKLHSENLKKISISFQHLTNFYEDKRFEVKWLKEDTKESPIERYAAEKSAAEESAAEESAAEESAAEESATEKSSLEESAAEESATEKSAAE